MNCFYCKKPLTKLNAGKCGCGRQLVSYCPECRLAFDSTAKFCMACGKKLTLLQTKPAEIEEEIPIETEEAEEQIEIHFDKPSRFNSDGTAKKSDSFIEIDFGDNQGKSSLTMQEPQADETAFVLEEEKPVQAEPEQPATRETHVTQPKINSEFITKWTSEPVTRKPHGAKKPQEADPGDISINFDDLFAALNSVNDLGPRRPAVTIPPQVIPNRRNTIPPAPGESNKTPEAIIRPEEGSEYDQYDSEGNKIPRSFAEASLLKPHTEQPEKYTIDPEEIQVPLTPVRVDATYDVSFDSMLDEIAKPPFEDSCKPMFKAIEENLRHCNGGLYCLRSKQGRGINRFINAVKEYAETMKVSSDCAVIVADANVFDFDFMIFINLVKSLMNISSNDIAAVRKKFDTIFAESLPESKKETLSALICLNFAPIKTRMPKHDIEYLLSFVLYCLCRTKPVLWIVSNADTLNERTLHFIAKLKQGLFKTAPMAMVCVAGYESKILSHTDPENIYDFNGFSKEGLIEFLFSSLNTTRIPADIEKLLQDKADSNMLFAAQLCEYLKDLGLIFEMRGSWRFSKMPDDFVCPDSLEQLIYMRVNLLPDELRQTLHEFTLLNLYSVPESLFSVATSTSPECVDALVSKGFLIRSIESISFTSQTIFSILKSNIRIGNEERAFYRRIVDKLAGMPSEIYKLNRHWLILSYINLGEIVDSKLNPFLFSSAVYMEKLGFFDIAQRSYQTIMSSFSNDDLVDEFRILPEIKNARLWQIVEPSWAQVFWQRLNNYAKTRSYYQLEMLSRSELLLMQESITELAKIVKELHAAGCYEDELRLIDKVTDILIGKKRFLDASSFIVRAYKLLHDIIIKSETRNFKPAEFIYMLYIRIACKMAELCIMLNNLDQAVQVLEEVLVAADRFKATYFKSKILFLLGKIRFTRNEDWKEIMKDGFYNALNGMDFSILKLFLNFFEENKLEDQEWIAPFVEYKNWINF